MPDARMNLLYRQVMYRYGDDVAQAYVKPNDTYENALAMVRKELNINPPKDIDTREYDEAMEAVEIMSTLEDHT